MGIRAESNGEFDEGRFSFMLEINIHTIFKDWRYEKQKRCLFLRICVQFS